ncbi:ubiquinone biosynthesis accessory factor UbiK [Aliagarivorans taiwanensis]|uniref:ubiquinone biosynthesis accessory factor UbiK n=1 Tax=Aliagarivorans taiwanensis TaxID=561966 RepID=UPI0003F80A5C|nr:accessory factor UbiK family protein [Aliagarivorans taiwanensis]
MINPNKIEEIAKQVSELVPPGLKSAGEEFERKVKQVVQAKLSQLDVVNREDFEVQTQVLLRTRTKLEELEKKVEELEARLAEKE